MGVVPSYLLPKTTSAFGGGLVTYYKLTPYCFASALSERKRRAFRVSTIKSISL